MLNRRIARVVIILYISVAFFLFLGVFMWPFLIIAEIIRSRKLHCPICEKRMTLAWNNKTLSYCNKCGSFVHYNDDIVNQ